LNFFFIDATIEASSMKGGHAFGKYKADQPQRSYQGFQHFAGWPVQRQIQKRCRQRFGLNTHQQQTQKVNSFSTSWAGCCNTLFSLF